jgi:hypothetical protein
MLFNLTRAFREKIRNSFGAILPVIINFVIQGQCLVVDEVVLGVVFVEPISDIGGK